MGAVSPVEAQRAHKIRTKLRKKKTITREDYAWLENYERTTGAPVKCPAPVFQPASSPSPTPIAAAAPALLHALPPTGKDGPTAEEATATNPPSSTEERPPPIVLPGVEPPRTERVPDPEEPRAERPKAPHVSIGISGEALMDLLVQQMIVWNGKLREEFPDAFILPDFYFTKIMRPCAQDLARKYMPDLDFSDDLVEAGVCVIGIGATFVQVQVLRTRRKKEGPAHGGTNGAGKPIMDMPPAPEHPNRDHAARPFGDAPPTKPDSNPVGPSAVMDGGGGGTTELSTFLQPTWRK